MLVWDCEDYIAEAERQLGGATVYKGVVFKSQKSKKKNRSNLQLILKRAPILVSCICYPRFTNTYLKFQVGQ